MGQVVEPRRPGCFLLSEAQGSLSRDVAVLRAGNKLSAGALVDVYYDDDKKVIEPSGCSGGVIYADVDATDGDKECVVITRCAEVSKEMLILPDGYTNEDLDSIAEQLDRYNKIVFR